MRTTISRLVAAAFGLVLLCSTAAAASDDVYFSANTDVSAKIVQKINAETVRVDISCWYLTDDNIATAVLNRFKAGVPVRLIGDRGSIFEIDAATRAEFYRLAAAGVPIRLRYNPTWYPEIDHWKVTIFAGQNLVATGSANYTPYELAPFSPTNYKDEVTLFTTDPTLVGAFKTKFDRLWNDTTPEPESLISDPPYFKNWNDACATESVCSDYHTKYPNPAPMVINTARLEPDNPLPPEMVWGQGPDFNDKLVQSINAESTAVDFVIYRLTVDNITQALIDKFHAGVPMRLIVEPNEYLNRVWPEFWLTHANVDKLWAAGIPIKKRTHDGLTHMKVLITSDVATIASSNYAAAWQRDADYFLPQAQKPTIWQAIKNQFQSMWTDTTDFADFTPLAPDSPNLVSPANNATNVAANGALVWSNATFATSYDVYLGTTSANMTLVANVPAEMDNNPPSTYSWTPATALQPGTHYDWRIIARTNGTSVDSSLVGPSTIFVFNTAGSVGPPAAPASPSPSDAATGVSTTPTLGWASGSIGTTYDIAFGSSNPPSTVATGLTTASYQPGALAGTTTYFWRVTASSSGGTTPGPVWSFTTGSGGSGPASDVVLYGSDFTTTVGAWTKANDSTAAGGVKLTSPDAGGAVVAAPAAAPASYAETTFQAQGGTRYRVWFRIHAIADSKFNDSFFVQFSDSVDAGNNPTYRIGTPGGYIVNMWTCSDCQSFGWGWQRNAYWLADTGDVWFQNSGSHTIRIQTREDGAEIDQVVISPTTYSTNAPGPVSNDTTIVAKGSGPQPPSAPAGPSPANNATGVSTSATLTWTASGATTYDVKFGTTNPPSQVATGVTSPSYAPPNMVTGATYFWQIVAHNEAGATPGQIWTFSTTTGPPATPNSPNPPNAATGVSSSVTLTWASAGATTYDVLFGTSDPPSQIATGLTSASYTPAGLAANTTYFWQIVAHNSAGANQGAEWTFTTGANTSPTNIVIYGSDVPAAALHGTWATASDASSPNGIKLVTTDNGAANTDNPLAAPTQYYDVSFTAQANVPYRIWVRLQALNNSKFNDAVWVQFSDATSGGASIYPINSAQGLLVNLATDSAAGSLNKWGWQNGAYWLSQSTTVTFPSTGTHTLRIQIREDGVQLDQIVLSPNTYLNAAPGPVTNDSTVVAKP